MAATPLFRPFPYHFLGPSHAPFSNYLSARPEADGGVRVGITAGILGRVEGILARDGRAAGRSRGKGELVAFALLRRRWEGRDPRVAAWDVEAGDAAVVGRV